MDDKKTNLAKAFVALESIEECEALLSDLCTIKEVEDMANRFQIALLLQEGQTFIDVEKTTGASSATISRVNRCLKHGKGYNLIMEKLNLKD